MLHIAGGNLTDKLVKMKHKVSTAVEAKYVANPTFKALYTKYILKFSEQMNKSVQVLRQEKDLLNGAYKHGHAYYLGETPLPVVPVLTYFMSQRTDDIGNTMIFAKTRLLTLKTNQPPDMTLSSDNGLITYHRNIPDAAPVAIQVCVPLSDGCSDDSATQNDNLDTISADISLFFEGFEEWRSQHYNNETLTGTVPICDYSGNLTEKFDYFKRQYLQTNDERFERWTSMAETNRLIKACVSKTNVSSIEWQQQTSYLKKFEDGYFQMNNINVNLLASFNDVESILLYHIMESFQKRVMNYEQGKTTLEAICLNYANETMPTGRYLVGQDSVPLYSRIDAFWKMPMSNLDLVKEIITGLLVYPLKIFTVDDLKDTELWKMILKPTLGPISNDPLTSMQLDQTLIGIIDAYRRDVAEKRITVPREVMVQFERSNDEMKVVCDDVMAQLDIDRPSFFL